MRKPLILRKIGANTARLAPWNYEGAEAVEQLRWHGLPDEVILDPQNQPIEELLALYPDYEVKR